MIENVKVFRNACKNIRIYLNSIKKLQIMMSMIIEMKSCSLTDQFQSDIKPLNQYENCYELMQLYYKYVHWVYTIINKVPTPYYQQVVHELFILKSLKGKIGKMLDCTNQSIYNECKTQLQKVITDDDIVTIRKLKQDINEKEKLIGKGN